MSWRTPAEMEVWDLEWLLRRRMDAVNEPAQPLTLWAIDDEIRARYWRLPRAERDKLWNEWNFIRQVQSEGKPEGV